MKMDEIINPIICYLSDKTNLTVPKEILERSEYFKNYFNGKPNKNEINIPDYIDPNDFREFIYSISFPNRIAKCDIKYLCEHFKYSPKNTKKQFIFNLLKHYKYVIYHKADHYSKKQDIEIYSIDITNIYRISHFCTDDKINMFISSYTILNNDNLNYFEIEFFNKKKFRLNDIHKNDETKNIIQEIKTLHERYIRDQYDNIETENILLKNNSIRINY